MSNTVSAILWPSAQPDRQTGRRSGRVDVLHTGLGLRALGVHDGAPSARACAAHTPHDAHDGASTPMTTIAIPKSRPERRDEDRQWGPWSLTHRELEVLQLLAEGATNGEISQRLYISPKTTKNHLAAIFQKLDVTNRTHALVRAVVMGLVTIE